MNQEGVGGNQSARAWAERVRNIINEAMEDGCHFHWYDLDMTLEIEKGEESYEVMVYKGES